MNEVVKPEERQWPMVPHGALRATGSGVRTAIFFPILEKSANSKPRFPHTLMVEDGGLWLA